MSNIRVHPLQLLTGAFRTQRSAAFASARRGFTLGLHYSVCHAVRCLLVAVARLVNGKLRLQEPQCVLITYRALQARNGSLPSRRHGTSTLVHAHNAPVRSHIWFGIS